MLLRIHVVMFIDRLELKVYYYYMDKMYPDTMMLTQAFGGFSRQTMYPPDRRRILGYMLLCVCVQDKHSSQI